MPPARPPRPRAALAAALLLALPAAARAEAEWRSAPPAELIARAQKWVEPRVDGAAVELPVDVGTVVILPLEGAQELELDYRCDGLMALSWAAANQGGFKPFGWLWRYARLTRGSGRLRLDLRTTLDHRPGSSPALLFIGTGHVTLTRLRWRPAEPTEAEALEAIDRARRLAPEPFGHVTPNTFGPSYWSATREAALNPRLGALFAAALALALAACWAVRRRWRPAGPVLAAALLAVAVSDAHALLKLGPPWRLAPAADPEQRLRDAFPFAPEVGALAAAAREALPATARVEVRGRKGDWFGPQALCLHLAPRPCVMARPGKPTQGLSGVTVLGEDQIDAVVLYNAEGGLPPGFDEVARVSPRAVVARRR